MAMNLLKIQDILKGTPDKYLTQMVQQPTGDVPQFLVLGEIQRRKDMRESAQAAPETTVADDLEQQGLAALQQASETEAPAEAAPEQMDQGVASIPTEMPEVSAAGGGIIAFEEGGDVEHFANRGYVDAPGLSEADVAYADAMRNSWVGNAADTLLDYTALLPYTLGKKGLSYLKGRQPVWDPVKGKYVLRSELPDTSAADKEAAYQAKMAAGRKVREDYLAANATPAAPVSPPAAGNALPSFSEFMQQNKNPLAAEATRDQVAPPTVVPPGRNAAPVGATPAAPQFQPTMGSAPTINYDLAGYNEAMLPTRDAAVEAARFKSIVGEDTGLAGLKDKLAAMEEKSKGEEERAPWMALVRAGLGMAAGTSPYALSNIGAGGIEGLKDYQATRDRLDAKQEKRFAIESQIAQAERAEQVAAAKFGTESEQYADTQNRLAKLHALDAENTAKIHDAANQLTYQRNVIEEQQGVWAHQDRVQANRVAANSAAKLSDYETYLQHAQKLPENWKVIKDKDGKEQKVFDINKAQSSYWNARSGSGTGKITEKEMRDAFQEYNSGKYFTAPQNMNYSQFVNWYNGGTAGGTQGWGNLQVK